MLWKDSYTLGVPIVDEQHKELFARVESFLKALRSDAPWEARMEKVNETLEFMKVYVVEHFRDEELYQQLIDYPGYEAHKRIHQGMVDYVTQVSEAYANSGFSEKLIQQFAGKLMAWLINHVAAQDQRIAEYASKKEGDGHEC